MFDFLVFITDEYVRPVLPLFQVFAIFLGAIAVIIAVQNFWRKSGIAIEGSYQVRVENDHSDAYIREIVLKNLKDRSEVIYAIYLVFDNNVFLEIKKLEKPPLIIKAYETLLVEVDPVSLYLINEIKVDINNLLLNDKYIKKQLMITTYSGNYYIKSQPFFWNPIVDMLLYDKKIGYIRSWRDYYADKILAGNTKYVVEMINLDSDKKNIYQIEEKNNHYYETFA